MSSDTGAAAVAGVQVTSDMGAGARVPLLAPMQVLVQEQEGHMQVHVWVQLGAGASAVVWLRFIC